MFSSKLVKRCLIPAAAVVAEAKAHSEPEYPRVCRPSELPIYIPEPVCNVKHKVVEAPGILESTIRDTRETITKYSDEVKAYQRVTQEHISKSKENIQWLVDYLHEEDNTLPRAGAVGIGALAGLIFGLRGGIIKRTLYATAGATGVAAICYPSEASEYSKVGTTEAKKYLTVAYNFVYGVKKDDPPLELPSLPKLPSSLTEVWTSVKSTFVSDAPETKAPQEQVIASSEPDPEPSDSQIQDPLKIIAKAHEESVEKQCHCPIGACLGREEVAQNPENRTENVAHLPDALDALQFGMAQD
ncbi:unnamed protein product [Acanthoscelides obtectus]|uniref:MICOS complex subunit n=1 Tax=Acanthoscelides obtectus TaxID=200917 RepID=A0A9P0L394_ACAOB|nr:unnamed protein product [Acanthoscelides obtectus]CAK1636520.1 MICOS complex subunit MIC27 [Acanthoscelides obtectus]